MLLERLLGEVIQVSAGGRAHIGVLDEVEPGVIRLRRVVMLVPTQQGTAMERLIDAPFEDFILIGSQFRIFQIREESKVMDLYRATISGIVLPEGGGN